MGSELEQQPAAERCRCGYLLKGLTGKRCPECGRPIPGKPRRKKLNLLWGFLIGFGIVAVPTLVLFGPGMLHGSGLSQDFATGFALIGLAIAVGTGLIGMLIGYGTYRWG